MDANGAISSLVDGQAFSQASDLGAFLVLPTREPLYGNSALSPKDFNGVWGNVVDVVGGVAYLRVVVVT